MDHSCSAPSGCFVEASVAVAGGSVAVSGGPPPWRGLRRRGEGSAAVARAPPPCRGIRRHADVALPLTQHEWIRAGFIVQFATSQKQFTGACSVAASYKPPMLVTRVRLPACAFGRSLGSKLCDEQPTRPPCYLTTTVRFWYNLDIGM